MRPYLTGEQKKRVYVLVREQRGVQHQGGDRKSINPTNVGMIPPTQADYASEMGVTERTVQRWKSDAKASAKWHKHCTCLSAYAKRRIHFYRLGSDRLL